MNLQETKQHVFETCINHLLKQGCQSRYRDKNGEMICAYRSEPTETGEVLMCAIGALIPDEVYTPKMEGYAYDIIFDEYGTEPLKHLYAGLSEDDQYELSGFLSEVQFELHDTIDKFDFAASLKQVALVFACEHELDAGFIV